jgi:hypothetical protein
MMPMPPRHPVIGHESGSDEYTTITVEAHPDMWTAEISRADQSGGATTMRRLFVNVGSISHLIAATSPHSGEEVDA